jgi:geranylgeranylglycerol-phosphate geranylgeranyltransferase
MSAAGVAIGALLVSFSFPPAVILAALAAFLITAAGNVINDVIDVEADKINRPKRPIPSGKISKPEGAAIATILFTLGLALSALTANIACLAIALFNSALLVSYSATLQNKVFVGNAAVAFLAGSTFLFGGAAAGNIALPLFLALLSGLATLSREIVKDMEDVEGDRKSFMKRLGKHRKTAGERFSADASGVKLKYSEQHAVVAACITIWLAVAVSAIPYALSLLGTAYVLILVPTDLILLYSTVMLLRKRNFGRVSTFIKYGMAAGLLAFLLGSAL